MLVTAGSTSKSIFVYFVDDVSGTNTGEPTTGLLFSDIETGGSASYARQGAARVDFALVTLASASAVYAEGGFILVDDTNMPGVYRLDVPNAALVTGIDQVTFTLVAASGKNTVMRPVIVDITDLDLRDAVRGGMTALPNANAEAAGGLYTRGSGAGQINQQTNGQINANLARWLNVAPVALVSQRVNASVGAMATDVLNAAALNADAVAKIADGVWDEDVEAAHGGDASAGLLLRALGAGISNRANNATLDALLGVADSVGRDLPEQVWLESVRVLTANTNLNDPSAVTIADAVWDEDVVAAHGGADTAGLIISELTKRAITFSTAVVDGSALGQIVDDGTAVFNRTTDSLQAMRDKLAVIDDLVDDLETRIPDVISLVNIRGEVATALSDIHLDHLLAVDYDPAAKPGVATALFNELVESDAGVSRFTTNALEQALDTVVESNGSITAKQFMTAALAVLAGVTNTGGRIFLDPSGTTTRLTAVVNANNERTSMTLNL